MSLAPTKTRPRHSSSHDLTVGEGSRRRSGDSYPHGASERGVTRRQHRFVKRLALSEICGFDGASPEHASFGGSRRSRRSPTERQSQSEWAAIPASPFHAAVHGETFPPTPASRRRSPVGRRPECPAAEMSPPRAAASQPELDSPLGDGTRTGVRRRVGVLMGATNCVGDVRRGLRAAASWPASTQDDVSASANTQASSDGNRRPPCRRPRSTAAVRCSPTR